LSSLSSLSSSGNPLIDNSFSINWDLLDNLPDPNKWSDDRFTELANLAASVQSDLETVSLNLCSSLREATGEMNLALVGGVALNSVMNAKILQSAGFENVYVPSAPGDEGIAVGCAMYGLQVMIEMMIEMMNDDDDDDDVYLQIFRGFEN
jgi:predicted NodU family carbamoyl transferase